MHAIRVMIRSAYKTHTTLLVSTLFTLITLKLIVLASPLLLGWAGAGALLAAVLALFYPAVAASPWNSSGSSINSHHLVHSRCQPG